jgi:hypothetical protein
MGIFCEEGSCTSMSAIARDDEFAEAWDTRKASQSSS